LYGEKLSENETKSEERKARLKGWFPRQCAVEVMNSALSHNSDSEVEDNVENHAMKHDSTEDKKSN
jgi:hypothetical protein